MRTFNLSIEEARELLNGLAYLEKVQTTLELQHPSEADTFMWWRSLSERQRFFNSFWKCFLQREKSSTLGNFAVLLMCYWCTPGVQSDIHYVRMTSYTPLWHYGPSDWRCTWEFHLSLSLCLLLAKNHHTSSLRPCIRISRGNEVTITFSFKGYFNFILIDNWYHSHDHQSCLK